jgi:hypothetical protein
MQGKVLIIDPDNIRDLARYLASIIKEEMLKEDDQYMTPSMIAKSMPVLSESKVRNQIRTGKYGKKIGEKGKLVAKISEVKKFNRL